MLEITGDIWRCDGPIVVTTNGDINSRGECVMGRGIALQAKQRYPEFPKAVGKYLREEGNHVGWFREFGKHGLITFPVKHHWSEIADMELIEQSAKDLHLMVYKDYHPPYEIYMVRPGCGNGGLRWSEVKPLIDWLDDRFVVVENRL